MNQIVVPLRSEKCDKRASPAISDIAAAMIPIFILAASLVLVHARPGSTSAQHASTFAGATTAAIFPPAGATITATDTFFLDASEVGFPGPTLSIFFFNLVP